MNARTTANLTLTAAFTLALTLFAATPFQLHAQDKGSAKGGAARLMQLTAPKPVTPPTVQAATSTNCKGCKDRKVTVRNKDYKGAGGRALLSAGAPTKVITRHECQQCRNDWRVSGHGKASVSVPVHACVSCQ